MKKIIKTKNAPAAVGPYSQAIEASGMIFLSGQIGLDPKTGNLKKTFEEQTKQVIKNLEAVLNKAGLTFDNVVKCDVFLKDINDYPKMNEIYGKYFKENPPARQAVEVSNLPKGALIEISCIAVYEK